MQRPSRTGGGAADEIHVDRQRVSLVRARHPRPARVPPTPLPRPRSPRLGRERLFRPHGRARAARRARDSAVPDRGADGRSDRRRAGRPRRRRSPPTGVAAAPAVARRRGARTRERRGARHRRASLASPRWTERARSQPIARRTPSAPALDVIGAEPPPADRAARSVAPRRRRLPDAARGAPPGQRRSARRPCPRLLRPGTPLRWSAARACAAPPAANPGEPASTLARAEPRSVTVPPAPAAASRGAPRAAVAEATPLSARRRQPPPPRPPGRRRRGAHRPDRDRPRRRSARAAASRARPAPDLRRRTPGPGAGCARRAAPICGGPERCRSSKRAMRSGC